MFTQAIASVFSSFGVLPPQRQYVARTDQNQKSPAAAQASPESAIVELSPEAQKLLVTDRLPKESEERKEKEKSGSPLKQELSEEEKKQVEELEKRDREVRAHERAHVSAGGQYVKGGAQFEYETGPNKKQYAVGGHVSIDTSPVASNPEATIRKAQVVRRAALAPADPSASDRAVAAKASKMESEARMKKAKEEQEERPENTKEGKPGEIPSMKDNLPEITDSGNPLSNGSPDKNGLITSYGQTTATLKIGSLINITV